MKFIPPIQFPVRIAGKKQIAIVEEQIGSTDQFVLFIRFTDGFEDIFYLDDEGGIYGTRGNSVPYEQSLKMDVGILIGINHQRFYHILEESINGAAINVWIIEHDAVGGRSKYGIYFNNRCQFELMRVRKNWIAFAKSTIYPDINQLLVKRVGQFLDNLLKLVIAVRLGIG